MKKVLRNGREFEVYTLKEIADYFIFANKNNLILYYPDDFCIDLEDTEDHYILKLRTIESPYKCTKFKLRPDDLVYLSLDKYGNFSFCELDSTEEKEIVE